MKNNQSWQERIRENFRKEFPHLLGESVRCQRKYLHLCMGFHSRPYLEKGEISEKDKLEQFLLQEGEKIREETIEECKKQIFDVLFATYLEYDDAKRASNEILNKLKSDSEEEK